MSVVAAACVTPRRRHYDSDGGMIFLRNSLEFSFAIFAAAYNIDIANIPTVAEYFQCVDTIGNSVRKIRRGGAIGKINAYHHRLADFFKHVYIPSNIVNSCLLFGVISMGMYTVYIKETTQPALPELGVKYVCNHLFPGYDDMVISQIYKLLISYINYISPYISEYNVENALYVAKNSICFFDSITPS
jgi:hypothetical protein